MSRITSRGPNRLKGHGLTPKSTVTGVLVALLVASCTTPTQGATPESSQATGVQTPATAQPTRTPARSDATDPRPTGTAVVYFVTDTAAGPRLAREVRKVPGAALEGALQAMIDGPLDPDYTTSWNPSSSVLSASSDSGVVTVDLSAAAREAQVDAETAGLMVQQLVFTATAADPTAKVQLLIDGKTAGLLWGGVAWDTPVGRADPRGVLSPLQTDKPTQDAQLTTDTLAISGEVLAGSTVQWRVDHATGDESAKGEFVAEAGDWLVPFAFTPDLGPGRYIVELRAQSADDPSGTPLVVDTREFSVHLAA